MKGLLYAAQPRATGHLRRWCIALLASVCTAATCAAAIDAGPAQPPPLQDKALEELDEIKVTGMRLWQMREALIEAEDRFYALYNELNGNDDFDVHCRETAGLGSRIRRRQCVIAFQQEALAESAQATMSGYYAPDAELVTLERRDEYRRQALAVINSDVRLRRLIAERERMEARFQAELRRRFKGR